MAKVNPIIQWWMTPKLPKVHICFPREKSPKGFYQTIRVYSRKWLIHPIKRRVAKYYLLLLQKLFGLKVIAITGSAGKTTVKEMILAILKSQGETVASYKNIDPVYNLPTTILKCSPSTKFLILEFGVEFPGEMEFYYWLAKPLIGVVTNIYPTHTQFFKNVSGVAGEKEKLVRFLPKDGFAILNKENKYTKKFAKKTKAKTIWFGEGGNVKAESLALMPSLKTKFTLLIKKNKIDVQLPVAGRQFVQNALAAASVGYALGIGIFQIKKGLENYDKLEHRMNIIRLANGSLLLDDSYNNNPEAAKAALRTFKEIAGSKKTIVVFGDMLELGKNEKNFHNELGRFISSLEIQYLIGVGKLSKGTVRGVKNKIKRDNIFWVGSEDRVDPILKSILSRNTAVLIKGSRSIGLDRLVSRLS